MAGVSIVMSGDDSKVQAMIDRQIAQHEKLVQKLKEAAGTSKKLSDEEIAALKARQEEESRVLKLKQEGNKIIESQKTANDKYADSVKRLVEIRKTGQLTEAQYAKELERLKALLKSEIELNEKRKTSTTAAAEAVKKSTTSIAASNKDLGKSSKTLAEEFKAGLESIVLTYAGVQAAIGATTKMLQDQADLQKENFANIEKLGKAQASAGQNFTGLTDQQKVVADTISLRVQKATGFGSADVLQKTAGEVYSAVPDVDAAERYTRASARANLLTPENLKSMAVGGADLEQATKIKDAERNLSVIYSTQSLSRVASVEGTSKNLPVIIGNAQVGLPQQNSEQLTQEMGSVFGGFSQRLVDKDGERTKTAIVELTIKMDEFARKSSEKLSETAIKANELRKKIAEDEKADLKRRPADRKGPDESDAAELKKLEAEQAALSQFKDPGTFMGRIRGFQQNQGAAKMLLEDNFGPGEARGLYQDLITNPNSDFAKQVEAGIPTVDTSRKTYDDVIRQQRLTFEQRLATEKVKLQADIELRRRDPLKATKEAIADTTREGLKDAPIGNIYGMGSFVSEPLNENMIRSSGSVEESVRIAKETLDARAGDIQGLRFQGGPLTKDEIQKLKAIEESKYRLDEIQKAYSENPLMPTGMGMEPGQIQKRLDQDPVINVDHNSTTDPFSRNFGKGANGQAAPAPQQPVKIETTLDAQQFTSAVDRFVNAVNRMMTPPRPTPSTGAARAMAQNGVG